MCSIMLSIKPHFIDEIKRNIKKYEYRRRLPKHKVDKIFIYSTSPIMKIVGEASVVCTLTCTPEELWSITYKNSGISRDYFDLYFSGCELANAFKLGRVTIYDNPLELSYFDVKSAPQSFVYISI